MLSKRKSVAICASLLLVGGLSIASAQMLYQPRFYLVNQNNNPPVGQAYWYAILPIDFSMTSSFWPGSNFPTWSSPNGGSTTPYYEFNLYYGAGCYEIWANYGDGNGTSNGDLSIFAQNPTWTTLNQGSGSYDFRARVYQSSSNWSTYRIAPTTGQSNGTRTFYYIRKLNRTGGSAITSTSCRQTGISYWENGQIYQ